MRNYILLALPALVLLTGCTSLLDKEQQEFDEIMARMNQVCVSCKTVYTDIVELKVKNCELSPMAAFYKSKESPVVLTILGLYSMNPYGYRAYQMAAEQTLNCSNEQKWADDISDFLSSKIFTDYYHKLMTEKNINEINTETPTT